MTTEQPMSKSKFEWIKYFESLDDSELIDLLETNTQAEYYELCVLIKNEIEKRKNNANKK